jgi:hypothetical protein
MTTRGLLVTALALVLLAARHAAAAPPSYTYCNSCTDCDTKLSSGSWTLVILNTDITDHAGHCIRLYSGVNDVTFDCDGHLIDGDDFAIDPEYGVYMSGGTGNEIVNCTISDFSSAILLHWATGHAITSNTLVSNNIGIELSHSSTTDLQNNVSVANNIGILLDESDSNTANSNSTCHNTTKDFSVYLSSGNFGTANVCDVPGGWSDAKVSGCSLACSPFADGFESGNAARWSLSFP